MVLIFSEDNDHSTNMVLDWLIEMRVNFVRINKGDKLSIKNISISDEKEDIQLYYGGRLINLNDVTGVWFRRGGVQFGNSSVNTLNNSIIKEQVVKHLSEENEEVSSFINDRLERINCIGSKFKNHVNKLKSLQIAKRSGLSIPKTWIINTNDDLQNISDKNYDLITKSISNGPIISHDGMQYGNYTEQVTADEINNLNDCFFPSLFQEKIEKEFELRIFYLNREVYSMAIFSQLDKQTSVDFRKYNKDRPNRTVPYNLPDKIKDNIIKLMESMQLNTGSVDMVVDKNGSFVFLEVNPVGQFVMVSHPCNFSLDKKIAEFLTNNVEHNG